MANNNVVTINQDKVTTSALRNFSSNEATAMQELMNSRIRNRVVSGELAEIRGSGEDTLGVVMYKGMVPVIIPLAESGIILGNEVDNPNLSTDDLNRKVQILQNMLGSEQNFIVTEKKNDEDGEPIFFGSRSAAIDTLVKSYYLNNYPNAIIQEGTIAEARVVSISKEGEAIRVDIFGVDVRMTKRDLFYEWVKDIHEKLHVGDIIDVKITELKIENDKIISLRADSKCLDKNRPLEAMKKLSKGDKCIGEIIRVTDGQPIFLHLSNGANAVSHEIRSDVKVPCEGDRVKFVVTGKSLENENVIGIITSILS